MPLEDYGTPKFTAAVTDVMKEGFVMLALIALRSTVDGQPLIEDEAAPGALDENVQKARQLFQDKLIEKGILKPDMPQQG